MLTRILALILLIILIPLFLVISLAILLFDGHPILFVQQRVGKNSKPFYLYKFRTMKIDTPSVATRLLENSNSYVTRTGKFLRKFSLDELPNLINMIKGEMTFVGPRPVLESESELIEMRKNKDIDKLLPGLTGLAQINGGVELNPERKVEYELKYKSNKSILLDLEIIFKTTTHILSRREISL